MNRDDRVARNLDRVMDSLEMAPTPTTINDATSPGQTGARKSAARRAATKMTNLQVFERGDLLLLNDSPLFPLGSGRRSSRRSIPTPGNLVAERPMAILGRNKIIERIDSLDMKLTPKRGLREWKNGKFHGTGTDIQPLRRGKKILLFVHGTFSESQAFFNQIDQKKFRAGRSFLNWASREYDQILTFDHPTLAVSPYINAHALSLAMQNTPAQVDVICHSRGGLVTRWWVEALDGGSGRRRVAFVGAPLHGTGLASPHNIRSTLTHAYNFGNALTTVSAALPLLQFSTGLFQIVTSILRVAGKTPLADAVVSLVPGLAAQSQVANNHELGSQRNGLMKGAGRNYFFVSSNFESERVGWKFWKYFRKGVLKTKLMDVGTDAIFTGANDLVVDTPSMTDMQPLFLPSASNIYDFGPSQDKVMHTNYFEQKETLEFIRDRFD